ncbi:hypothetical protein BH11MYX1_BH11MYX1_00820 [soil metagenome]
MKRAGVIGFFVAMALVFAIVAAWTPVQGDGWLHWVWAGRHPGAGIGTWLLAHSSAAEAFGYVLARCPSVHIVFSPVIAIALVVGLFVVAMGRTPTGDDLLGLALVSAIIWVAQPHPGVTWFYTTSTAMHIYGAAAAVWLIAPLRCGWKVPAIAWPGVVMLAYCAGTSTRAIAVATLVAMIWIARGRWKPVTLVLFVATVLGFLRSPYLEVFKVARRGMDPNLFVLKLPIEEVGKVVALVAVFALIELGRRTFGKARSSERDKPDTRTAARLLVAYLGLSVFCIFGPKYYEATLFPATCVLVVATLPWLLWFAQLRAFRITLAVFAFVVHAIAWGASLETYRRVGKEGAARFAVLSKAAPGSSPTVAPYSEILQSTWFFGEDFSTARLRQLVAIDVFGLHDISLAPAFRRLEVNPMIQVAFEQEGATPAELAAAMLPPTWSTVPSVAREQFEAFTKRLNKPVMARLVVKNMAFKELRGRPLLVAWTERDKALIARAAVSTLDEENQYTIKMSGVDPKQFDEAWWLQGDLATKTPYRNGSPRIRPTLPLRTAVVFCDDKRCLLLDAFVPHF